VRHGLTGEQESRRAGESGGERADMLRMRRRKERATVPIEWTDLSTSPMEMWVVNGLDMVIKDVNSTMGKHF